MPIKPIFPFFLLAAEGAARFANAAGALRFKVRFAKIDTEQFPAISQRLQIRGIPLLILYAKGREILA